MPSISVRDVSLRFPVYGLDSKSLKRHLAKVAIGGRMTASHGVQMVAALDRVNLELRSGDRLGLVGHNGSGKTTLLRLLAGAYQPDAGEVEIKGRRAALLDLSLGIDPNATGIDNIYLRGRLAGLTTAEIEARLEDITRFSGLGPYLAMPLKTYSAGMQARLAFAVSTSVDAEILLMDEWLAVGDADFQQSAQARLQEMVHRSDILVLASHDAELLRAYCNKVLRLTHGVPSAVADIADLEAVLHPQA